MDNLFETEDIKGTEYGVFIIESLSLDDEIHNRLDGRILADILELSGVKHQYFYIRTRRELEEIIKEFDQSGLRYLHFSCHADDESLALTYDSLDFAEFGEVVGEYLHGKRLFLASCYAANEKFAKEIIPDYYLYSLIGSPKPLKFAKSALFWSTFYNLMIDKDQKNMRQEELLSTIEDICRLLSIPINYYSFLRKNRVWNYDMIKVYEVDSAGKACRKDINLSDDG